MYYLTNIKLQCLKFSELQKRSFIKKLYDLTIDAINWSMNKNHSGVPDHTPGYSGISCLQRISTATVIRDFIICLQMM